MLQVCKNLVFPFMHIPKYVPSFSRFCTCSWVQFQNIGDAHTGDVVGTCPYNPTHPLIRNYEATGQISMWYS